MFKKTLVALAIVGFSTAATAATINSLAGEKKVYSIEGIANETLFTAPDVVVRAGIANGYSVGDKLVFKFTNDKFDISTAAAIAVAQDDGTAGTAPDVAFSGPVYSDGNTVTFTVGAVTAPILAADKITLSGIKLEKANLLAGGKVAVDFKVISSVNNSDYEAKAENVVSLANQFKASVETPFDGIVDVNKTRKLFTADAVNDTLVIKVTNDAAGVDHDAVLNAVAATKATVKGDFSFLDTDADGTADYSVSVLAGGGGTPAVTIAKGLQSFSFPLIATTETYTVTVVASDATKPTTIPVQSYTADVALSYDPATAGTADVVKTFAGLDAGKWKLNGASGELAFLPFGEEYARSITVTNTGTLEGEITVDLIAGGKTFTKTLTAKAVPGEVTNISAEVNAFAEASAITGNASVKVVVNAPKTAVFVTGVYYHFTSQDRILMPTKAGE